MGVTPSEGFFMSLHIRQVTARRHLGLRTHRAQVMTEIERPVIGQSAGTRQKLL